MAWLMWWDRVVSVSYTHLTRKMVLEYDDVMNTQREVIYKQRRQVLDGEDLQNSIQNMLHSMVEGAIQGHMGEQRHMTDVYKRQSKHCPPSLGTSPPGLP